MDRSTHQVGSCGHQDHLDATNRQHTPLWGAVRGAASMDTTNCDFPVAAEVLRLQKAAVRNPYLKEVLSKKRGTNGLLVNYQGNIWIPTNAVCMQVRLCVIAHCGRGRHRGHQVTLSAIQDQYYWRDMSKYIKVFVGSCFHCNASAQNETTSRPRGEVLHASKPNEVIHFDYLYMGPSLSDAKYVLILTNDCSNYVWLNQCKNPDADRRPIMLTLISFSLTSPVMTSCPGLNRKGSSTS
jgi:Integrase zinc binding domain